MSLAAAVGSPGSRRRRASASRRSSRSPAPHGGRTRVGPYARDLPSGARPWFTSFSGGRKARGERRDAPLPANTAPLQLLLVVVAVLPVALRRRAAGDTRDPRQL